jgi:alpha-tubulin suppressor-like RCC1 family protein
MASKINADEFVDREGEGKPTLPKGVVLSGVTTITTAVVAGNEVANSTGINAGIITSTHFKGNLTGDVNAGIVTVTSQTVVGSAVTISASGIDIGAGVITATSYVGSASNLTGIGATIMVWEYNPDPYDTAVTFDTGIGITFNQKIKAGSGNITLSIANAGVAGTVVENFGIGNSVTITNNSLSIDPTSDLSVGQDYIISYPSGVITNMAGDNYVGTAYTFQTRTYEYQLWGWGQNDNGVLGQNNIVKYSSPVQVPGTNWETFAMSGDSGNHSLAIKSDGTLWAWGYNNQAQLGLNNRTSYSSPVQVPGTTWNSVVAAKGSLSFATKTDGTLWSWGYNGQGQLGLNTNTRVSSPTQIPGTWDTGDKKYSASSNAAAAIKADGTLWVWGRQYYGSLGLNQGSASETYSSSPAQIPGTTWRYVNMGTSAMTAIKTDGTFWAWGTNSWGGLGQNNRTHRSSPVQVPGTTWAVLGGTASSGTIATKTDGTIWSWGTDHSKGGLGQNNEIEYSSPVQIGSDTTWSTDVSDITRSTEGVSLAIKTDGTLWTWGYNNQGQLGNNATANQSSPVQIGSDTTWDKVHNGKAGFYNGAIKKV